MATTSGNEASSSTTTSSGPSRAIHIPCAQLPFPERLRFINYYVLIFKASDKDTIEEKSANQRALTLAKMTDEQRRTFPILAEDYDIIKSLRKAQGLKDRLEELTSELRLEAEKEIDRTRDRY